MKEILESAGFIYMGACKVCSGNADLYQKGDVQCKIMPKKMKFEITINGKKIIDKSNNLQFVLNTYMPKDEVKESI